MKNSLDGCDGKSASGSLEYSLSAVCPATFTADRDAL